MIMKKHFPTIIHEISENINGNNFYMKRDDLLPFCFGGNKARKALNFFADIEKSKSDAVVTYGTCESNHCRIIANMAKSKNIPCYIISPEDEYKDTYNHKLIKMLDGKIIVTKLVDVNTTIEDTMQLLHKKGYHPYFIQGGGHGNIGTEAYVSAYKEILDYELTYHINFDYIFHASGTGTTQAGLVCGKMINNDSKQIIGLSIARTATKGKNVVVDSAADYLGDLYAQKEISDNVVFIDDYILGGYSKYNDAILSEIKNIFCRDGVPLNTTYTGKSFWGMKQYIKKNKILEKNILFINTGGLPIFFDNLEDEPI